MRDLISLVLDHMLVVEPLQAVTQHPGMCGGNGMRRITSGGARDRLWQMLDHGGKHPAYHIPSKARTELKAPSRPPLQFETTAEKLREEILATHGEVKAEIAAEEG